MRAKKDNFELFHVFFIELFLKDVLGLLACEGTTFMPTFQVKARLYEHFIAVRKYNFLDSFFICFGCVQNLCCNDSKYQYHSLK